MNAEAHEACLRAIQVIARSARICATSEIGSTAYTNAAQSSERVITRARNYYSTASEGRLPTERPVRLLQTALVEATAIVTTLASPLETEPEDLERMASKVERAIARCTPLLPPPPSPASPPQSP